MLPIDQILQIFFYIALTRVKRIKNSFRKWKMSNKSDSYHDLYSLNWFPLIFISISKLRYRIDIWEHKQSTTNIKKIKFQIDRKLIWENNRASEKENENISSQNLMHAHMLPEKMSSTDFLMQNWIEWKKIVCIMI